MKTEIYNLIILDESGSMSCVKRQTISGCNETLNTIRNAQKKFAETQDHYVSIYAFQSGGAQPSRYIIKNAPIDQVEDITKYQYAPDGCTPLYDAVGSTLSDLKVKTKNKEMAIGSVTIITDGMENSSEHYDRPQVARLISQLKEIGWSFNFIGANIDVQATASSLNIDNALEFRQDDEGTRSMFAREAESRMAYYERTNLAMEECASCAEPEERYSRLKKAAKGYFDKA
ncbi:MAG: hypothetical protein LIP09_03145 [Bacteroidales bacterium]|nr:hypothetical protein [Bacteroidales bacterium]